MTLGEAIKNLWTSLFGKNDRASANDWDYRVIEGEDGHGNAFFVVEVNHPTLGTVYIGPESTIMMSYRHHARSRNSAYRFPDKETAEQVAHEVVRNWAKTELGSQVTWKD